MFIAKDSAFQALKVLASLVKWSLEELCFILCIFVRVAADWERINEFEYFFGVSEAGKDVLALMFYMFFSDADDGGYCGGMPGAYFEHKSGKDSGCASPYLSSLVASRVVIIPEVPPGTFGISKLKDLTEQEGAKIRARALFKSPKSISPSWTFLFFSNYPMQLPEAFDSGMARRIVVYEMPNRFSDSPTLTQSRKDPSLKRKIKSGSLNNELFVLMVPFFEACFQKHPRGPPKTGLLVYSV